MASCSTPRTASSATGRRRPDEDKVWYHYNAQSQLVSILPGASFFSSLDAFTMARGGRLDVVILGGMQVSEKGDLANWWAPYMAAGGMGGAMDLCTNVPELIVIMEHTTRDGEKRILNKCEYPLTAGSCVTKIVTDLALIEVTPEGLVLKETAPGVSRRVHPGADGAKFDHCAGLQGDGILGTRIRVTADIDRHTR